MAKSSTYFGLRRGSTKSHTFSVVDGKQITKDRVEGCKNPRTLAQMSQRCMVATIGVAYSAMKCICDHSFKDLTAGMQCMRNFMHENLKQIRISKEYGNGFYGFCKFQQAGLVPGSYIISDGSLPKALVDAEIDSVDATTSKVTLTLVLTSDGTVKEVAEAMGCRQLNDMCTVAVMYPKADGSYGFGAVRFTYKSGATVLESFPVAVIGDFAGATPSFSSNTLKVEVRLAYNLAEGATTDNTYMAAITSRCVNGNWLRSPAQFDVTDATPTFAQAIATYPVGQERFLNGSDVDIVNYAASQGSGSSQSTDSGSTGSGTVTPSVSAPTFSGNTQFTESTQVSMSGPAGAEIRYTTNGSTPTAQSTLYSGPLTLTETTTVKAIAIKDGQSSTVTSRTYSKVEAGGGGDDEPGGDDH